MDEMGSPLAFVGWNIFDNVVMSLMWEDRKSSYVAVVTPDALRFMYFAVSLRISSGNFSASDNDSTFSRIAVACLFCHLLLAWRAIVRVCNVFENHRKPVASIKQNCDEESVQLVRIVDWPTVVWIRQIFYVSLWNLIETQNNTVIENVAAVTVTFHFVHKS